MNERPMKDLFDALEIQGNSLPVTIHADGRQPQKVHVSGDESSQFGSALMLVGYDVETEPHPYVEMTRKMKQEFNANYAIEPDLSSASYFVAAGWLTGGKVGVAGWPKKSLQIDGEFPRFLPPAPTVSRASDLGDSVMTLAICALFAKQPMKLVDASRMRLQETDRIKAMVTELRRVGAKAEEHEDGFTVWPAELGQLHGADIETYNDHRMAMCFAVLGLKVPGIRIKNPGCVGKTFPNFFERLEQLRR
jgi:3-phosphoshikimate 1-carboxyvinyltransferase